MVSAKQIREVVQQYIQHGDADAFVLAFSKLAFGISKHGEPQAIRLAQAIDGKIALVHAGHLSEDSLRDWLRYDVLSVLILDAQEVGGEFYSPDSESSITLHVAEQSVLPQVAAAATQGRHERECA